MAMESRSAFSHVVSVKAVLPNKSIALCSFKIGSNHLVDKLVEARSGCPTKLTMRLGRIAQESFNLGRAEVARIDGDDDVAVVVVGRSSRPRPFHTRFNSSRAAQRSINSRTLYC